MSDKDDSTSIERKPLLSGPKRQHFLPRFYLEGFARDGLVAVFDRAEAKVRVQAPVNTGVIGHFYTMTDEHGRKRFEVEHLLSEYEGKASPVIAKLATEQEISPDERSDLAIFIALGAMRTPSMVDSLKDINSKMIRQVAQVIFSDVDRVADNMRHRDDYRGLAEQELRAQAELMINFAKSGNYTISTDEKWAVGVAIQTALELAPIFVARNWIVAHCDNEKKSFVTSDAPVMLLPSTRSNSFYGVGFASADAQVLFPLTQSCVLLMHGNDAALQHRYVNQDVVRQTNLGTSQKSQRFVVGRDAALVGSLASHLDLASKAWKPAFRMS